ncbi:MAG: polymer-forming cytoskeletal protein [Chloroflexota bacterium]
MSRSHKLVTAALLVSLVLMAAATPVAAFDGRGGDKVSLPAGEVVNDDLYVGANEFILDGTVNGDVVSAARSITVNGSVNGNLVAAGQTVVVNGSVSGDILAAGSVLFFGESASVGGDVIGAGYSLEFRRGSTIGRDAVLAAAQILLAADVGRNVKAGSGALQIAGMIGGDVRAAVGEASQVQAGPSPTVFMPQSTIPVPVIQQGLTLDPSAKILGDLEYTQNSELSFPAGVVDGTVTRLVQPEDSGRPVREPSAAEKAGQWALRSIRSLVTLLLLGLFLLWLIPGFLRALSEHVRSKPWASLGWGVLAYAAFFFLVLLTVFVVILGAVVFGLFTLGGLSATIVWVGILVLFALILGFVLATSFLAKIVFGMTLGKWILVSARSPLAEHRFWPMVLGVAITVVVIALLTFPLVPGFLGGLVNFAIVLFGLGALWLWIRPILEKKSAPAV